MKTTQKQSIFKIIIICTAITLFIFLPTMICAVQYKRATDSHQKYQTQLTDLPKIISSKTMLQLSDNFMGELEQILNFSAKRLDNLIAFNTAMYESDDFIFEEFGIFDIYLSEKDFHGDDFLSQNVEEGVVALKSLSVGPKIKELFQLKTIQNKWFAESDFYYLAGDSVPVILGASYMPFYEVGDEINITHEGNRLRAKVLDFFEKDSVVVHNSGVHSMDDAISIPIQKFDAFAFETLPEEELYHSYLNRNNGLVFSELSAKETERIILSIAEQSSLPSLEDTPSFYFINHEVNLLDFVNFFQNKQFLFLGLSSLLFVLTIVLFHLYFYKLILSKKKSTMTASVLKYLGLTAGLGGVALFIFKLASNTISMIRIHLLPFSLSVSLLVVGGVSVMVALSLWIRLAMSNKKSQKLAGFDKA